MSIAHTFRPAAVALGISAVLVSGMLTGCSSNETATTSSSSSSSAGVAASAASSASSAAASSSASTSAAADSASTSSASVSSDLSGYAAADSDSTDGTTGTAGLSASSSADADVKAFNYSEYLNDDGTWADVVVADLVTLPDDYDNIQISADAVDVTDAVEAQIQQLASLYSQTNQVTDRAVADGDTVNIDFVGTIDGVEFDGGNTQGLGTSVTIGVTQYIDGFLEQLVGHTPGETFDINVTFPDDYVNTDLAGKDAVFSVTINYISEQTVPEITDEWVSSTFGSTYGWSTVEEMTASITDTLQTNAIGSYVTQYLVDNSDFASEFPQQLIDYQVDSMVNYYQTLAQMYGLDLDESLSQLTGYSSMDEVTAANSVVIDRNIKRFLAFQRVAELNGITASDEDVQQYLETTTGSSDNLDAMVAEYGMPYLRFVTLQSKAIAFVQTHATVVDRSGSSSAADDGKSSAAASSSSSSSVDGSLSAASAASSADVMSASA